MGHVGSEEASCCSSLDATPTKSSFNASTPILHRKTGGENHFARTTKTSNLNSSTTSTTLASFPADSVECLSDGCAPGGTDLSGRKEMVEMLDCNSVLDYLTRNGALTREQGAEFSGFDDPEGRVEDRNRRLLQTIEGQQQLRTLFVNALRLSGQHFLANMADDGVRIKALSGSGYLSKSRHKGQVEMHVLVKCVKMTNDAKFLAVSQLLQKNSISLEDIQSRFNSVRRQQRNASTRLSADLDGKKSSDVDGSRCGCCLCCCIGRRRKKKSEVDVQLYDFVEDLVKEPIVNQPMSKNGLIGHKGSDFTTNGTEFDGSVEDLKKVSHAIQAFCQDVYRELADPRSELNGSVVRYFEQNRGVLMLGADSSNNKLHLNFICTKVNQVDSVERDIDSGKFANDLARLVCKWLKETERKEESLTFDLQVVGESLERIKKELSQQ